MSSNKNIQNSKNDFETLKLFAKPSIYENTEKIEDATKCNNSLKNVTENADISKKEVIRERMAEDKKIKNPKVKNIEKDAPRKGFVYLYLYDLDPMASARTLSLVFDNSKDQNNIVWVRVFETDYKRGAVIHFVDEEMALGGFWFAKNNDLFGRKFQSSLKRFYIVRNNQFVFYNFLHIIL